MSVNGRSDLLEYRRSVAEQTWGLSSNAVYRMFRNVIAKHDLHGRILDYGAGAGWLTKELVAMRRFERVAAVDILDRPDGLTDCDWFQSDLNEPLRLVDNLFDVVVAAEVIEHLENPRHTVREIARVLRPGGVALISTPNNESWRALIALLFRGHYVFFGDSCYPAHITPVLRKDLARICRETGLTEPQFFFTDDGGLPGKPSVTWQALSLRTLKGLRYSDNILAFTRKPAI